MYKIDGDDEILPLSDVPEPCSGAPMPGLVSKDGITSLAYFAHSDELGVVVVKFLATYATIFGPPNDEALDGHPLGALALGNSPVVEVRNSSWISNLIRMNSSHPSHDPEFFREYRHFIFLLKDSTFECVAKDLDWTTTLSEVAEPLTVLMHR